MVKSIFVHYQPVPKGRPRFTRGGHTYTPARTKNAEKEIIEELKKQWSQEPLETALIIDLTFYLPMPKYLKGKVVKHTKRPDADNLAKLVLDAMNEIIFKDDSQITYLKVKKLYEPSDYYGVNIVIKEDLE